MSIDLETFVGDSAVVILQDSGARREFESGAVRDVSEGKGRCDLLPLDVVGSIFTLTPLKRDSITCAIFEAIENFKVTKETESLLSAIVTFCELTDISIHTMLLETSKHFESGALKYGENNWKKGMPLHCYIDSAVRHFLKHLRGDTDEPHDRAFVWNLLCAVWTLKNKPELDDIERDIAVEPIVDWSKSLNEIRAENGLPPVTQQTINNIVLGSQE